MDCCRISSALVSAADVMVVDNDMYRRIRETMEGRYRVMFLQLIIIMLVSSIGLKQSMLVNAAMNGHRTTTTRYIIDSGIYKLSDWTFGGLSPHKSPPKLWGHNSDTNMAIIPSWKLTVL